MIVSLTGSIEELGVDRLVLNVRGVGYELGISSQTHAYLATLEDEVSILCRLVVREGSMSLYGFHSAEERLLFDKLCQIGGVGPKLALSILSAYGARELSGIVRLQDDSALMDIPGVGKKMAARLVIELQSIFDAHPELCVDEDSSSKALGSVDATVNAVADEVASALCSLGFSHDEVDQALRMLSSEEISDPAVAIGAALRQLGGGLRVGSRS